VHDLKKTGLHGAAGETEGPTSSASSWKRRNGGNGTDKHPKKKTPPTRNRGKNLSMSSKPGSGRKKAQEGRARVALLYPWGGGGSQKLAGWSHLGRKKEELVGIRKNTEVKGLGQS